MWAGVGEVPPGAVGGIGGVGDARNAAKCVAWSLHTFNARHLAHAQI